MNSPMKALEKLSEEAKLERQRSTASLQENARLKIQLESLKNQLQDVLTNNENYVSQIEQMEHDYLSLEERNKSIEEEKEVHIQKKKEMQMVIDNYEIVVKEFEQQKNEYLNTIASLNTTIEEWNEKYISIEMRLRQKDDLIQQKHEEIVRIKTQSEISEEKNNLLNSKLNEQLKIIENLKNKNSLMNSYEETIQDLQTTNFELRSELENTLKTNTDIRNEIQEYKQKQMEIEIHEETLNTTIHDYEIKIEHLESNISNYEEQVVELNKRVEAEHEVAEAARLQASVAAKGREFVDQKSAEMTQAYDNLFEKNHELTTQCTEATVKIQSLQNELLSYKDKCKQMDQLIQQVESNSNMTIELEYLRSQLSDMRKKLIRKDMEEDATSHLEPRALMDREKNSRAVYEGIILDLRTELDSITSTYHDTCQKLETSLKKCARVDQLEEEVAMYRDAAHSTAMESQSVAMSASEAVERSEQSIHEKHLILRDLKAVENELSRVTAQNARINEEYQLEKIKCKKYHVEKLAAERKASELLAGKARAEAVLDELKQGHDTELLELDRCRRNNKEYLLINNDLKRRISEMEKLQKVTEDSEHSYKMKINEILGRENSLMEEVKLYKQGKENLDKELEQCQHLLNNTKHLYQESQIECNKLYQMIEDLQLERERYHKDITLQEDSRAEVQLQSLRQELQQTVTDWKNSETEKATQDKLMNELRNDLTKEKEKNVLLKTQIALVEDRNKVALQELSVYRSLDVYHTTMNSELNQYRSSNLSNNPNASLNGSINNDASHLYMSQRNNNRNQRYSMMHSSASAASR